MTIITENHPKWPFYSQLRKCAEITASGDGTHFGINCSYCPTIFTSWRDIEDFFGHLQRKHADVLHTDGLQPVPKPQQEQSTKKRKLNISSSCQVESGTTSYCPTAVADIQEFLNEPMSDSFEAGDSSASSSISWEIDLDSVCVKEEVGVVNEAVTPLFGVIEINAATEESEVFVCPLIWFCKATNIVTYPHEKKFEAWKGRLDKPAFSIGAKWMTEPGKLMAEFSDYESAILCAKRFRFTNTTRDSSPRSFNASKGKLMAEFSDNESAIICAKRFQLKNTTRDNNPRSNHASKEYSVLPVESLTHPALIETNATSEEPCKNHVIKPNLPDNIITTDNLAEQISIALSKTLSNDFAKMHASLEKITEQISELHVKNTTAPPPPNDENVCEATGIDSPIDLQKLLPIADEGQLEQLDRHLGSAYHMQGFINEMSRHAGTTGRLNGPKIASKFIDDWFKRDFFAECSWTGSKLKNKVITEDFNVKEKQSKKLNFPGYKKVIEAFHKVIKLADSRYTINDAEMFLKKKIRHANR